MAKFAEVGIRPVAISVDTPEVSRDLVQKANYTFTFLSDPKFDFLLTAATLGTSGWLVLTRLGLSPGQKHQALLGALMS